MRLKVYKFFDVVKQYKIIKDILDKCRDCTLLQDRVVIKKVKNLNDYLRQKQLKDVKQQPLMQKILMDLFLCYLKLSAVAGCFFHENLELDFFSIDILI